MTLKWSKWVRKFPEWLKIFTQWLRFYPKMTWNCPELLPVWPKWLKTHLKWLKPFPKLLKSEEKWAHSDRKMWQKPKPPPRICFLGFRGWNQFAVESIIASVSTSLQLTKGFFQLQTSLLRTCTSTCHITHRNLIHLKCFQMLFLLTSELSLCLNQ